MNPQEALINLQKANDQSHIAIKIITAYDCCSYLYKNFESLTLEDSKNIHTILTSIIDDTKNYLTFIQPDFAKTALELFEKLHDKCSTVLKGNKE